MIGISRRTALGWLAVLPFGFAWRARAAQQPATQRYLCTFNECDPYVYDPLHGDPDNVNGDHPIPPGTAFTDLPEDWLCPVCGSPISYFVETEKTWSPSD